MKRLITKLTCGWLFCAAVLSSCSDDPTISGGNNSNNGSGTNTNTGAYADLATDDYQLVYGENLTTPTNKPGNIAYQILVYSFADSDGDGWGDLNGITAKLDYLHEMGVSALWLSPIHPASSYHGYDVKDYDAIESRLGTQADFANLITAAHAKGIKIYLDYVLNHTSTEHTWFTQASSSTASPYYNYYSFSADPATDIANGNIAMIASEGAAGYNAGEWFTSNNVTGAPKGVYKFTLDWSSATAPKVTMTAATTADADNTAADTNTDKYLYFGNGSLKKFYAKGNNQYELTVNFDSDWGFLVRTSTTSWANGTKFGAPSTSQRITVGTPFTMTGTNAANIMYAQAQYLQYHSNFSTASFADLNYGAVSSVSSNATYQALLTSAKGWIDKGVDGFRLDAVKHIYHNSSSTENPTFLNQFYTDLNTYYKGKGNTNDLYMVGEVLDDHAAVTPYYKGLPALFEFAFWFRLSWAINNNQGFAVAYDYTNYRNAYAAVRSDYIAATKLSNHDEERTGSVLRQSKDKERLAAAVLLTSSGQPYVYYGEELGYYGVKSNGDEYVRTPMLWGDSYNTKFASYSGKTDTSGLPNVENVTTQKADTTSLLNAYIKLAKVRNTYPALATGQMSMHATYNHTNNNFKQLAAWYMTSGSDKFLVLHNFGSAKLDVPMVDSVGKLVLHVGGVASKVDAGTTYVRLGAYSSAVYQVQ